MTDAIPGLTLTGKKKRKAVLDGHDLSDMKITFGDLMLAGHCVRGIRRWFDARGLDWRPLMKDGVSAVDLAFTEDGLAIAAIRSKIARIGDGEA